MIFASRENRLIEPNSYTVNVNIVRLGSLFLELLTALKAENSLGIRDLGTALGADDLGSLSLLNSLLDLSLLLCRLLGIISLGPVVGLVYDRCSGLYYRFAELLESAAHILAGLFPCVFKFSHVLFLRFKYMNSIPKGY